MRIVPLNNYLIRINKPIVFMPVDRYVQWASIGPQGKFYIDRGSAGGISISIKSVTVLAQKIEYENKPTTLPLESTV